MRVLAMPLAVLAFHGQIAALPTPVQAELKVHSWHRGCPVPLSQLRLVTVSYWGFDHHVHTGSITVNAAVASPLLTVFRQLYALRFPLRHLSPVDTGRDNTSSFECRDAVSSPCPGTSPTHSWSMHAYGEAVDINPV